MVNAEQHGTQFPQFKALLDAAATSSDDRPNSSSSSSCVEDESMAAGIRRLRLARADRPQRRRVPLAALGDNEIIGI